MTDALASAETPAVLWVPETAQPLRDLGVCVDQAAEPIVAHGGYGEVRGN